MYDLIGDIHGHSDALVRLLKKLGYTERDGIYGHLERQAIFLGDFIDRGPKISETLKLVRPMIDSGAAMSVMGNHELNALAFHTSDHTGAFLRPHSCKNIKQHLETIRQLPCGVLSESLEWFRTLPLWLNLDGLRVVHACWDAEMITHLGGVAVTDAFLIAACRKDGRYYNAVETLLKGKEAVLPANETFQDADGHPRSFIRVRWFDDPSNQTYGSYSMNPVECDQPLAEAVTAAARPYPDNDKPVFIGHYWREGPRPELLAPNVACVDWSIAKGGFLCAYRWDGEQVLDDNRFVWVE